MNTKKLNAALAIMALQAADESVGLPDDTLRVVIDLSQQLGDTELCRNLDDDAAASELDKELLDYAISLIQDYIRSVSTGINIGDRVEVLENNPEESIWGYYDKGEVGIVTRMLEESCIVDFGGLGCSSFGTAEIPLGALKKITE